MERFSGLVYFSICHLLRTRGTTLPADLIGEVHNAIFLSLLEDDCRRLRRFSGRCKLSHWIKVVSVNRTIDFLRKQRPDVPLDDPNSEGRAVLDRLTWDRPDPEEEAMRSERSRVLGRAVARLSPADQLLLRLIGGGGGAGARDDGRRRLHAQEPPAQAPGDDATTQPQRRPETGGRYGPERSCQPLTTPSATPAPSSDRPSVWRLAASTSRLCASVYAAWAASPVSACW